jgi:hypothetical protein
MGPQVCSARPDYASEVRQLEDGSGETPIKQQKKNQTKINLRQFFGANVKFHKNLRRYLLFPPLPSGPSKFKDSSSVASSASLAAGGYIDRKHSVDGRRLTACKRVKSHFSRKAFLKREKCSPPLWLALVSLTDNRLPPASFYARLISTSFFV